MTGGEAIHGRRRRRGVMLAGAGCRAIGRQTRLPRQTRPAPASGRRDCPARGRSWGRSAAAAPPGLHSPRLTHAVQHPLHPDVQPPDLLGGQQKACRIKTLAKPPDIAAAVRPGAILGLVAGRRQDRRGSEPPVIRRARKIPYPGPASTSSHSWAGSSAPGRIQDWPTTQSVQTTFSSRFPPVAPRWTRTFPAPEFRPPAALSSSISHRSQRVPAWPIGLPCTIQRSVPLRSETRLPDASAVSHAVGSVGLCRLAYPQTRASCSAPSISAGSRRQLPCLPAQRCGCRSSAACRPRLANLLDRLHRRKLGAMKQLVSIQCTAGPGGRRPVGHRRWCRLQHAAAAAASADEAHGAIRIAQRQLHGVRALPRHRFTATRAAVPAVSQSRAAAAPCARAASAATRRGPQSPPRRRHAGTIPGPAPAAARRPR